MGFGCWGTRVRGGWDAGGERGGDSVAVLISSTIRLIPCERGSFLTKIMQSDDVLV